MNQQYKLKPKIILELFRVIRFLYKLEGSGAPLESYFRLPSHSNLWIFSEHYLKKTTKFTLIKTNKNLKEKLF